MTKEDFINEMNWFTDFYNYQMNKTMATVWFDFVKNIDVNKFHTALKNHIKSDDYTMFPAFGKIQYQLNKLTPQ